ncbi:MAG: ATP-binding cassette domain-containing protein [Planctomycetota bacterium]
MAGEAIVEVASLTHRYGDRVALDGVTLSVDRGTTFALLGPNGGGKTTLFKILTTLITPTSGTARVAGGDVVAERNRVRGRIGIVFQKPSLDGKLTVLENLTHQGHLYGLWGQELRRRGEEVLEQFRLTDRANDRVDTLSGGLQRRVELAKGLLHKPEVLILDEPSTGLDPGARVDLMAHLRELRDRDGVTSLLTTHLMDDADRCDRVGILDGGRPVTLGTPSDLKATIGGDVVTIHSGNPNSLAARTNERFVCKAEVVDGSVRIEGERGHEFVPQLIEAFPGEIDSVTVGKPTLDDVFLHHTGHRLWIGGGA